MITIYEAADTIDAQRVVDLLASEGIAAHVSGSYLSGAIGEIPAGGLVRVWVEDADAEQALALLAADAEDAFEALPDDDSAAEPAAPEARAKSMLVPVLVSMLVGALVGGGFTAMHYWSPGQVTTERMDLDGDGDPDVFEEYVGEELRQIRRDRNGDGVVDEISEYPWRTDTIIRVDDNFDGTFESTVRYSNDLPTSVEVDLDGDGVAEWHDDYTHGVLRTSELTDADSGRLVKRVTFSVERMILEEFDADGDGTLETVRHYDTRGEIKP